MEIEHKIGEVCECSYCIETEIGFIKEDDFEMPDILEDEVLPTSGIIVVEHVSDYARGAFIIDYLATVRDRAMRC